MKAKYKHLLSEFRLLKEDIEVLNDQVSQMQYNRRIKPLSTVATEANYDLSYANSSIGTSFESVAAQSVASVQCGFTIKSDGSEIWIKR